MSDLFNKLKSQQPFSFVDSSSLMSWIEDCKIINFCPGDRILRPDEISDAIFLVLKGQVRLLASDPFGDGQFTLGLRGPGQLLGWVNLLRGHPTEFVQASTDVVVLVLSATQYLKLYKNNKDFADFFDTQYNFNEAYHVYSSYLESLPKKHSLWQESIVPQSKKCKVLTLHDSLKFLSGKDVNNKVLLLSTPKVSGVESGQQVTIASIDTLKRPNFTLPLRFILAPRYESDINETSLKPERILAEGWSSGSADLYQLGILEEDKLTDQDNYPAVISKGQVNEILAILEMIAKANQVPFRRDNLQKVVSSRLKRDQSISLEMFAGLCEYMTLNSYVADTQPEFVGSLEFPVIAFFEDEFVILWNRKGQDIVYSSPRLGLKTCSLSNFASYFSDKSLKFVNPSRTSSSPTKQFGWSWFTPLLKKYKTSIGLVFLASLLSQLFALAIPLLIQQIIDKVLNQGNMSSLNILGAVMVILALFSGILKVLRTYIFVDTTDRMDLTLGSSVIGKLLSLPISFFERRPVGELSQRIGELNTIRGFLTGTALISVLNIIFAALYLIVMFVYSPYLSVIALSTFPLYLILVFVVSPIYKSLIRKRAVAQAKTQSHLIEVLGGIQTVKAQNFELTARWKWQDRYKYYVSEGFKSTALGSTAGEIGNFLNQVSSLLVLWIGMTMILKGEFTLGQLIAFRIISGNVTGPLLQLAGLYQGFQSVQLSMERLSDVLDQKPEFQLSTDNPQIPLPVIQGNVKFENVSFRFVEKGDYQVKNVSFEVASGDFVGIVGQSGSGKSTLMKLLPKLYQPENGRISIDNYDISKVDLQSLRSQIGIVPQDSLLFEGTIAENIALNDPEASSDSIIEAAKIACAHEFIMTLGQGYATPLAERGSNLSGGQRQRIAIARTILNNPNLLVLDEATSALDFETEKQLCFNLQKWSANKTVFFITHRLTTVKDSDLILVMEAGSLVQTGSHEQLLEQGGMYSVLYRQQEISGA